MLKPTTIRHYRKVAPFIVGLNSTQMSYTMLHKPLNRENGS